MKRVICKICLMVLVSISGCGTIMLGPTQDVIVTSNPPGAVVTPTDYKCWVKTPGIIKLKRANSTVLTARLHGYEDAKQKLQVKLTPWLLGNAAGEFSPTTFFSNHVPATIVLLMCDMATGSVGQLSPAKVHFKLVPKKKRERSDRK